MRSDKIRQIRVHLDGTVSRLPVRLTEPRRDVSAECWPAEDVDLAEDSRLLIRGVARLLALVIGIALAYPVGMLIGAMWAANLL